MQQNQHIKGAKLDQGKNRMGLVLGDFSKALIEISKVGTEGANKYTDHGWVDVKDAENRYTDALFRHLFAHLNGEVIDPDFGLTHLSHAAWNALAILQLQQNGKK